MKIIYLLTEDWYFWLHRAPIAKAVRQAGNDVLVAVRVNEHGEKIKDAGLRLAPLSLNRSGKNPLGELSSLLEIIRLYRTEKPDVVHHVALKPTLYGAIAAFFAGTPRTVNALAGLGHVFISKGLKATIVRFIIKRALSLALKRKNSVTIFENPDDLDLLVKLGIVPKEKAVLILGTGVDTSLFTPPDVETSDGAPPVALLSSRMLMTKGIGDFVEAARILKEKNVRVRMALAGAPDPHNPASIPLSQLEAWHDEGAVEYWGFQEDMTKVLKESSIVVLPSSYGEGVPRSLMEAASAQRPMVTYDVPGCREIVRDAINGILVEPKNIRALAEAIETLATNKELRATMGAAGRKIVEREFAQEIVIKRVMELYKS